MIGASPPRPKCEISVTAAAKTAPYNRRGEPNTRNADDAIYRNGGKSSLTRVTRDASGATVATITMGVHRS